MGNIFKNNEPILKNKYSFLGAHCHSLHNCIDILDIISLRCWMSNCKECYHGEGCIGLKFLLF